MPRTGDETDDYCTRCHRLTNHTIVAMLPAAPGEAAIAQVACRTCGFQHEYRGARTPARPSRTKASAFDQVLAGILGESGTEAGAPASSPRGGRKKSSRAPSPRRRKP